MFFSSGTNDNKPNQVVQLVKSPVKIESLNDALDTEKAEIKREPDPKTDDKNEDIKTVQVNLISSSGQENSPPDLNQDSSESTDAVVTSQQPEPDFNFGNLIKAKIEQQQGMFLFFFSRNVGNTLKGSLDSIPSPPPSVKIHSGTVCLRCKGKVVEWA